MPFVRSIEVYEDRARKSGRKISLNVMILPALSECVGSDPVFYLQGGPRRRLTAGASFMGRLHRTRDVVLVDQRGTGKSNLHVNRVAMPIKCEVILSTRPGSGASCRTELEKNADLSLYTTE
jgi:hypothetical protein